MKPTNRPITSREYKLLLNTERFRERPEGTRLFWKLIEFLVHNQGNEAIPTFDNPANEEKKRVTWYLDTPGFELRRANITLRVRQRAAASKPFKVTLKYRAPDRYSAAGRDVSCSRKVSKKDIKFEEDVVPPFASKFSYAVSFKNEEPVQPATMGEVVELFPGLAEYGIAPSTPVRKVNGFQAQEVVQDIGKLTLARMPVAMMDDAPSPFEVNAALSHWYLREDQNDYPLVTEFSFAFSAEKQEKKNRLEMFPPTVVAGANRLFRDLQNQAGWLAQFGTTKTAYVFEVL